MEHKRFQTFKKYSCRFFSQYFSVEILKLETCSCIKCVFLILSQCKKIARYAKVRFLFKCFLKIYLGKSFPISFEIYHMSKTYNIDYSISKE